jgi:heme oxygenase (biliverdin-producing, ferredoxin)
VSAARCRGLACWDMPRAAAPLPPPSLPPVTRPRLRAVIRLRDTGLERSKALAADLAWFAGERGVPLHPEKVNSPGAQYAVRLRSLAASDIPSFVCHYYNVYFAHTAGGMMIGKMVSKAVLDGAELAFYQYDGDLNSMKEALREEIEAIAGEWDEEEQARSVAQTREAFSYAGAMMRCITQACDCDCRRSE